MTSRSRSTELLLDLVAPEAELSRVIMLNAEPPPIPESPAVFQDLFAAHQLVHGLIAKLQKQNSFLMLGAVFVLRQERWVRLRRGARRTKSRWYDLRS
jgi:hypothetical protein